MPEPVEYRDLADIERVVQRFESCAYTTSEFSHARHLTVAAWYLSQMQFDLALTRMREYLLRFTSYHGVKGYHETITRFWLELVRGFLEACDPALPLPERVNELVRRFPRKDTIFEFYSRERLMSEVARMGWLEPDLQGLDGTSMSGGPKMQ